MSEPYPEPYPEPPSLPEKVRIVTHYAEDDPKFMGDYCGIKLYFDDDRVPTVAYGDSYHDKGQEKIQGWIDCLKYLTDYRLVVERENVADYPV